MGAIRVRLLKSYKHEYKSKSWPVGQVLQLSTQLASELIGNKTAELYKGDYPPKSKMKSELFKSK